MPRARSSTLAPPEPVRTWPDVVPAANRTLGWAVLEWTTEFLLQPDGPGAGEPWVFTDEQARIVLRWYEIDAQGRFRHRRGTIRRLKGWGKDPFTTALAACELCGPCRFGGFDAGKRPVAVPHPAPWIQTAAVSRDQTRNTMTLFPGLFSPATIDEYDVDLGKEIIYAHGGRGRIEAVTSSPRSLEGGRPSLVIANETHHWLANNEGLEMAEAIKRNLGKSRDGSARMVEITNAHLPGEGSVAEATFEAWRQAGGRIPGVYYDSVEAPPVEDLSDEAAVKAALLSCRGDSTWLDVDRLAAEIADPVTPPGVSRRFYLNQVTEQGDTWLPDGAWEGCEDPHRVVDRGVPVVLAFDGSKNGDATAVIGVTVEETPHVFVVGIWEPPADATVDWRVPRRQVLDAIRQAAKDYRVLAIAWDDWLWLTDAEDLEDEGLPIELFPQNMSRMGPATQRFYEEAAGGRLTQDGNEVLARHIRDAATKTDSRGTRLVKDAKHSRRRIDGAVCAVMALDTAAKVETEPEGDPHVW